MTTAISDRPIRIGIADDNDLMRIILRDSLDSLPCLKVVGYSPH
jgi:hypothetical protein